MKGFISIVAASAVLSAGLVAGLSVADATPSGAVPAKAFAKHPPVQDSAASGWVDPPLRQAAKGVEAGCRAAWPYRAAGCAAEAPARKVRVIAVEGQGGTRPGLATPTRLPGAAPTALALR